jgi:hypothetical protein
MKFEQNFSKRADMVGDGEGGDGVVAVAKGADGSNGTAEAVTAW